MASINKTDRGTWTVRWRQLNGQGRKRTFRRRVDAEAFRTEIEAGKLRGETINPKLGRTPFAQWCDEWLTGRISQRASTRARDEASVRNHIKPRFGHLALGGIEPSDIRAWINDLSQTLSPATVRKAYQLLAACLQVAVDDGLIGKTPCRNIELPRIESSEPMFLSVDEIGRLVGCLPLRHRAIVLTAAFTGLRWGELSALRISDLELLRRRLTVNQTAVRAGGTISFGPPKTAASRRTVSLPPVLVEVLAEHLQRFPSDGGFVFTGEKGAVLRSTNFRRRVWLPAVEEAGLDGLRFHDLRHSHAALLIAAGEHVKVIQSRLGHASAKITLDTYGHLFEGLDESAADRLNQAVSEARVPVLRPFGEIAEIG